MRCDAETNNGACNAVAHWEADTASGVAYCCNHHFLCPSPAEWVDLPWRPVITDADCEDKARQEHFQDEYNFERNYTAER